MSNNTPSQRSAELYALVASIPFGRIACYGQLGKMLSRPVSGLVVGRWMYHCPADLPWHRVVGSGGRILLGKMDPTAAAIQEQRLLQEGVAVENGCADVSKLWSAEPR